MTRREEGKRDEEEKDSCPQHMIQVVLRADPFSSVHDKVNTDLSSAELVLGGVGGQEGKKAREMRKRKTAGTMGLNLSLHDKVNTDLSSAELVLGGVGGREGKKARETRKRKTAGTAITCM